MKRLVMLLAALFAGALLAAAPASAHASVVASSPADGSRLQTVPSTVSIDFDEQIGLGAVGYLHVTNQGGERVESGTAFHPSGDGTRVAVRLKPGLPDGTYVESYRVLSDDSHPVAGVVRFVVGSGALAPTAAGTPGATVDHTVSVSLDAARWLSYAGFAVLGGAWLLLTVWPHGRGDRRARRIVWAGWAATVLGAVVELLLQGAYTAGGGLGDAVRPALVDATLHTDYGQYHCVRLMLLGLLALLLGRALRPGRVRTGVENVAWPAAVAIAFTFSATGHARTTDPSWLSLAADTAHLSAMAVWVGGLVILIGAVLPRREAVETGAVLPVFSRAGFTAVIVLAVTGTYAAWRGVGSWRAFVSTEYGLLVLLKIVLFVGIVALGNVSRRSVQRRYGISRPGRPVVAHAMTTGAGLADWEGDRDGDGDGDEDGTTEPVEMERLRRSVLVEIALAVGILAATAVLVGQPRGSEALAAHERAPAGASIALGNGRSAAVAVDPVLAPGFTAVGTARRGAK